MLVFHTHTCLLIACLHAQSMLAYPSLVYLHCVLAECQCVCVRVSVEVSVYVVRMWWKCQCVSVSVEVSVFKGFSGRTLRNAFGKKEKERKREGEKGRGEKGRCSQLRTIVQGHTKEGKGDPEYYIQENPRKQGKKGGGQGEKGAKFSTGSNEPRNWLRPLWSPCALPKWLAALTAAVT